VRRAGVLLLALLGYASPAFAQRAVRFIPDYEFHLAAEHLSDEDRRYVWDADFGGSIDVVDYGIGRFTFWANYEVVTGEQLRIFDPNQGNYVLAGSASARFAGFEVAGVFYHQSRHLSDRIKILPVDWNMLGGRILRKGTRGRVEWEGLADLRKTIQHSFVDYTWELDTSARARVALRPRVKVIAAAGVRALGVDGSRHRGTQTGVRSEAGLRLEGDRGAIEVFVAGERRIDPYPVEVGSAAWATTGFRLVSK
jgi:hypothetical protein